MERTVKGHNLRNCSFIEQDNMLLFSLFPVYITRKKQVIIFTEEIKVAKRMTQKLTLCSYVDISYLLYSLLSLSQWTVSSTLKRRGEEEREMEIGRCVEKEAEAISHTQTHRILKKRLWQYMSSKSVLKAVRVIAYIDTTYAICNLDPVLYNVTEK